MAGNFTVNMLDAETAFVVSNDFALILNDLGIDQGHKFAGWFVVKITTNDDQALKRVNLNCRQCRTDFMRPGIFPIKGCGYHVVREFYDIVGDDMNSGWFFSQVRIWQGYNIVFRHS